MPSAIVLADSAFTYSMPFTTNTNNQNQLTFDGANPNVNCNLLYATNYTVSLALPIPLVNVALVNPNLPYSNSYILTYTADETITQTWFTQNNYIDNITSDTSPYERKYILRTYLTSNNGILFNNSGVFQTIKLPDLFLYVRGTNNYPAAIANSY